MLATKHDRTEISDRGQMGQVLRLPGLCLTARSRAQHAEGRPRQSTATLLGRGDEAGNFAAETVTVCEAESKAGGDPTEGPLEICVGVPLSLAEYQAAGTLGNSERPGRG